MIYQFLHVVQQRMELVTRISQAERILYDERAERGRRSLGNLMNSPALSKDRWLMLAFAFVATVINYLDRQTLATLAPVLRAELRLSNADYGWIVAAFSVTYAVCAPFAGLLIDRIGLYRGITLAIECASQSTTLPCNSCSRSSSARSAS